MDTAISQSFVSQDGIEVTVAFSEGGCSLEDALFLAFTGLYYQ